MQVPVTGDQWSGESIQQMNLNPNSLIAGLEEKPVPLAAFYKEEPSIYKEIGEDGCKPDVSFGKVLMHFVSLLKGFESFPIPLSDREKARFVVTGFWRKTGMNLVQTDFAKAAVFFSASAASLLQLGDKEAKTIADFNERAQLCGQCAQLMKCGYGVPETLSVDLFPYLANYMNADPAYAAYARQRVGKSTREKQGCQAVEKWLKVMSKDPETYWNGGRLGQMPYRTHMFIEEAFQKGAPVLVQKGGEWKLEEAGMFLDWESGYTGENWWRGEVPAQTLLAVQLSEVAGFLPEDEKKLQKELADTWVEIYDKLRSTSPSMADIVLLETMRRSNPMRPLHKLAQAQQSGLAVNPDTHTLLTLASAVLQSVPSPR